VLSLTLHSSYKVQPTLKFIINQWKPSSELILCERKTSQSIEQAYTRLKEILLESNCKINAEEPPNYIRVTQGSLMGILPMNAKKVVSFNLSKEGLETKIASSSQIAADWKNLTLYGSVITAFLIWIFVWITIDLKSYIETARPGFWAWLAQIYGPNDTWRTNFMISLIQALAIFLVLVIVIEILIVIYVYPRKNTFSRQILEKIIN
jgi:hypothetical protein